MVHTYHKKTAGEWKCLNTDHAIFLRLRNDPWIDEYRAAKASPRVAVENAWCKAEHDRQKKNQRINILISESLNSELSRAAEKSGVTKSAFVRVALERELTMDKKLDRDIKAQTLLKLISN